MKKKLTNFRKLTNHLRNETKIAENGFSILKIRKGLERTQVLITKIAIYKFYESLV